jgi:hypothetical protein
MVPPIAHKAITVGRVCHDTINRVIRYADRTTSEAPRMILIWFHPGGFNFR